MTTVTAQELLILDERRFDAEYYKWMEYCLDYDWWACECNDITFEIETEEATA